MAFFDEARIVDSSRFDGNTKSCIQKSGRLGFTREGAALLDLSKEKRMLVSGMDNGDIGVVIVDADDPRGFRIQAAGEYYYVKMKNYFDSLGIDYVTNRVMFSISMTTEEYQGHPVFKFKREIAIRKATDKDDIPDDNFDEDK